MGKGQGTSAWERECGKGMGLYGTSVGNKASVKGLGMEQGHVARAWCIRQGHGASDKGMGQGYVAFAYDNGMWQGHVARACGKGMWQGHRKRGWEKVMN